MLRDVAVARVKQLLGFQKNLDDEIVQAFMEVQEQLEQEAELPFFLRKSYNNLATVEDVREVNFPTDFIREEDSDQMFVTDSGGTKQPVVKDERGFLRIRYPGKGLPKGYSTEVDVFHFYPIPDAVYALNGTYFAKALLLDTNIQNRWLKFLPEIIIARGGIMLSGIRDQTALQLFISMNTMATKKLSDMSVATDMAGARLIMGGED